MSEIGATRNQKITGHLFALFTTLVWGSCFVLTKVMLNAFTPIQIIPLRMGLAYLALWALRPKTLKLPWKDELMFILIGITGGSVYFFLQNTAAAHTSAANVSISPVGGRSWVSGCIWAQWWPSPALSWWC